MSVAEEYIRRSRTLEAVQWDGSVGHASEINNWAKGAELTYVDTGMERYVVVDHLLGSNKLLSGHFILRDGNLFHIYSESHFKSLFERLPASTPLGPLTGPYLPTKRNIRGMIAKLPLRPLNRLLEALTLLRKHDHPHKV